LFDHYNGRSIAMHVAGEGNWLNRSFLRACFGYVFRQLRVNKVIGLVDSGNESARRFDEHLGFRLEATITGAGMTGDLLIYTMTAAECRWLGER
jgi:RimJ/RimL family protein N-acetyltransferase